MFIASSTVQRLLAKPGTRALKGLFSWKIRGRRGCGQELKGYEESKHLKTAFGTLLCWGYRRQHFARQGRVFLGLPLSGQETQEEFLKGHSITTDQKKVFRKAFHTYYDGVAKLLQSEHASLRRMEHEDVKMFNAKGESSDDNVFIYFLLYSLKPNNWCYSVLSKR
ncbi:NONSENSE-MEDIATED MRNA DECAY PROTEIN 2 UP-FRAMESHIFT SUPPRESSOR 2 [Salix purpurea]|uniref:NONSENSE-MEDIATED MRNA DECAY PROTEIN 2 UP-FRAMESHIFT SUPPRESSOR 2 n=1 Tax=Salix purpurea TaxID=77065 RepID=A0A9Q0V200_SALPP|nr:NONSENSE-MEDIATED MRNA DECAY PROTEIN 2 UP-FRAMESHIFT SUPPRESSOR 2 [Salix purpurea]